MTFPDPTGASRVETLARAPGNYLDGGGCHRALVCLMSPLTPASVAIAREIWRPCWAVNNRINLPFFNHRCHLCSLWWNAPMLTFRGDVFFLSVPGYKARLQWPAMGKNCRKGGSAGSAQGSNGVESCLKWRVEDTEGWQGTAGEVEDSSLWAVKMDHGLQWETPLFPHLFNHQAPLDSLQVYFVLCLLLSASFKFRPTVILYIFKFSFNLLR